LSAGKNLYGGAAGRGMFRDGERLSAARAGLDGWACRIAVVGNRRPYGRQSAVVET